MTAVDLTNGHVNGHAGPSSSNLSDAQEAERLLSVTVEKVLKFIRAGEAEDAEVTKWSSAESARAGISLFPLSIAASKELSNAESRNIDEIAGKAKRAETSGVSDEDLFSAIDQILENSVNPWTGRFLDKLYSAPQPIGLASELILTALNANCHVMTASPVLTLAEEACVREISRLCGWIKPSTGEAEDLTDGLTMPGGSAANTLALQTALSARFPMYKEDGLQGISDWIAEQEGHDLQTSIVVLTSAQGHYSLEKACIAAGLGRKSCLEVECDEYGRMDPQSLEEMLESLNRNASGSSSRRRLPFFVNATSGTTVLGSFDNLESIAAVCKKYKCWLHVDGSWGGPVLFSSEHRDLMKGIEQADSFTINPHKALNVPLQCSFLVLREGKKWFSQQRDGAAYLFHSSNIGDNAGMKTLGCGRRGDALKFYLHWLRYGKQGLGKHIDDGITLAEKVAAMVKSHGDALQLHPGPNRPYLQVCFRPTCKYVETHIKEESERNAVYSKAAVEVRKRLQEELLFAVDFAPLPRDVGYFIRLVTHPRTRLSDMQTLVDRVAALGRQYFVEKGFA